MSLYGALFSGVTALNAQSQAIGAISDNIANVNTVGYKATATGFETLVTEAVSPTTYTPGGVGARPTQLVDRQGTLQASSSATDVAIAGQGMLVVNTSPTPSSTVGTYLYTRAGSFTTDANGNLKNTAGYFLQGWPIDAQGNIPSNQSDPTVLQTVNVNSVTGTAQPTTTLSLQLNLQSSTTPAAYIAGGMAAGTVTPSFARSVAIVDSQGGSREVTFGFFKDAALPANQWQCEVYLQPATDSAAVNGAIAHGGSMGGGAAPIAYKGLLIMNSGYGFVGEKNGDALLVFQVK